MRPGESKRSPGAPFPWRAPVKEQHGSGFFPSGAVTAAVLSLYPRLDKAGYVPRKSIESEPLLEHGLALGVALVDAVTLMRALDANVR